MLCRSYFGCKFSQQPGHSSQLRYVIWMGDEHGNANILHYGSVKSRRIARSVLVAKLICSRICVDQAKTMRLSFNNILEWKVNLALYTDSNSFYKCLVHVNGTSENCLLIDLALPRQAYERRKIDEVVGIPSHQNLADALTKALSTNVLNALIDQNKTHITTCRWVDRERLSRN